MHTNHTRFFGLLAVLSAAALTHVAGAASLAGYASMHTTLDAASKSFAESKIAEPTKSLKVSKKEAIMIEVELSLDDEDAFSGGTHEFTFEISDASSGNVLKYGKYSWNTGEEQKVSFSTAVQESFTIADPGKHSLKIMLVASVNGKKSASTGYLDVTVE